MRTLVKTTLIGMAIAGTFALFVAQAPVALAGPMQQMDLSQMQDLINSGVFDNLQTGEDNEGAGLEVVDVLPIDPCVILANCDQGPNVEEVMPIDPCLMLENCDPAPDEPGDNPGNDGSDEPGNEPSGEPNNPEDDNPGDNPGDDNPGEDNLGDDNPGVDDGGNNPGSDQPTASQNPEHSKAPQAPAATGSKLPNTGSMLILVGAAGLAVIVAALAGRKLALRRPR